MSHPSEPVQVFLADDALPLRARMSAMLGACGMVVVGEAASPEDCIAGILGTRPSVVVLDVQLAGGNGLQVLHAVRAAAPGIAFVVFSHSTAPGYRRRYLAEGAQAFLDKSIDCERIASAVFDAAQCATASRTASS